MNRRLHGLVALAIGCAACAPPAAPTRQDTPGNGSGVGTHVVSWSVGDECTAVPPAARQRTYSANLTNGLVTLTSGVFLLGPICTNVTGLGCNQFRVTQDADTTSVDVTGGGSEWHGGQIVERVEDGTWIEVWAKGTGRLDGSTIRAELEANIWYCPTAMSYPFPCNTFRACSTKNMQMTIAPKGP